MLMVNHLNGFGSNTAQQESLYLDEFTGSVAALSSHTSDSGASYSKGLNTSTHTGILSLDGSGSISGGILTWSGYKIVGVGLEVGQKIIAELSVPVGTGSFNAVGITFAWTDSVSNEYFIWFNYYNTTTDKVRILARHNATTIYQFEESPSERPTSISVELLSDGTYDLYYNDIFWRNADPVSILGSGNVGTALGLHTYTQYAKISRAEVI